MRAHILLCRVDRVAGAALSLKALFAANRVRRQRGHNAQN
jgi:hypothetical protein